MSNDPLVAENPVDLIKRYTKENHTKVLFSLGGTKQDIERRKEIEICLACQSIGNISKCASYLAMYNEANFYVYVRTCKLFAFLGVEIFCKRYDIKGVIMPKLLALENRNE